MNTGSVAGELGLSCRRFPPVFLFCLCAVLAGLACAGCSARPDATARGSAQAVLAEVTRAYVNHLRTSKFRPPADEAEFKKILSQAGDQALKGAGVRSVDELLVSPRDSKPFVIAYGQDARRFLGRGIVALEREGVSGRRLVGYSLGYVDETDAALFNDLLDR